MTILVVGVDYHRAPVAVRERMTVPMRDLPGRLAEARAERLADEVAILSTCNRTEWYLASDDPQASVARLWDELSGRTGLSPEELCLRCYQYTDRDAVAHLFRVTAGLESMVLGESEVMAQVKQAHAAASAAGSIGPLLHRAFQKALHSAKAIRANTGIAAGQASIGAVVARLVLELFGGLAGREALLWGAGKAAESTTRHLAACGLAKFWIVNRTAERAQELAALCRGGWLSWEQARERLASVDLAVVCTQAPHYVLDPQDLAPLLPRRQGRPLCLIDLAMPRNIDPAVGGMPGIHLYNIDQFDAIAKQGLTARQQELTACEALIEQQLQHWSRWRAQLGKPKEVVGCRELAVV